MTMINRKSDCYMTKTNSEKIKELLEKGVENIYPSREALEEILISGKKLRIYTGIDPTGKLHLGHAVLLRKLLQFQNLGHEIIILIGDFTARIGDPTDKSATRKQLTKKEIEQNAKDYKNLIGKILDLKKKPLVRFLHNEEWINKLKPENMLELASHFTVSRLLERDMFQKRLEKGKEIYLHEFLYPIFQAYDAVIMDVDMEVGGNDQTFNMLIGRTFMKKMKNKEKFVLTTKLLVDPSGKKMGKTEGNMINLDEKPEIMYGKIMSWPDTLIDVGFELCAGVLPKEIAQLKNRLEPRDLKARLAREIVTIYHGVKKAQKAEKEFEKIFKKHETPSKIPSYKIQAFSPEQKQRILSYKLQNLLVKTKLASSKAEARRLIEQGGVRIDGKVVKNWQKKVKVKQGTIFQVGKRKFLELK